MMLKAAVDGILGALVGYGMFANGVSTASIVGLIAFLLYIFTRAL